MLNGVLSPIGRSLFRGALLSAVLVAVFAVQAAANGAAWNDGADVGVPGPQQQSALYLEKEHVVFDREKVVAKFWVRNPTNESRLIPMGFPVDYSAKDRNPEGITDYWKRFSPQVTVSVDGNTVPFDTTLPQMGEYPIVISWKMVFPAQSTTLFTVTYPMDHPWGAFDGSGENMDFLYITHTGASWARPIGEATFELKSEKFV